MDGLIMSIETLVEMSRRYGADEEYVLAGGGNTSFKEDGIMRVKCSGAQLSCITPEQFVAMDVRLLRDMVEKTFPAGMGEDEKEAEALHTLMAARLPGEETKRPSVESILHAMFPYRFVLHLHPALVNGLACAGGGKDVFSRLFGAAAVWIGLSKPGLALAQICKKAFEEHKAVSGKYPNIVILENHGIFLAADSAGEIDRLMEHVTATLKGCLAYLPHFSETPFDRSLVCSIAPALRMLFAKDGKAACLFCANEHVLAFLSGAGPFGPLLKPFTPDQIVYCGAEPLFIESGADIAGAFSAYVKRKGVNPKIVAVAGLGVFALGKNRKAADGARLLFLDAVKIAVYAKNFGGAKPLPDEFTDFILNWEAEQYREKVSTSTGRGGRLDGRIAVVTGGAQGFGKGIARALASEGAYVAVADLNRSGAGDCSEEINAAYGVHMSIPVETDVSDELSVERMIQEAVLAFGGLDVLISNAGVLFAGGLGEMTKETFDLVTRVNYTGYFLCAKYAAEPMKIQNKYAPGFMSDIIEINSKSGLEGSKKNFAYSGSKFGGVGLTQSFAKELVEYGIKVNAICPGNFFDGPLWSDPERGLFRQYLDSGKVEGAGTIEDVRRFYESKVPLKRGCTVADVVRAIIYVIEQEYETGQAIPVTGGQIMLH